MGFEGTVNFLMTLQGRGALCVMCSGGTHRHWLGSTGPGMGYTALAENLWGTEKRVAYTPQAQFSSGQGLDSVLYIFLTLDTHINNQACLLCFHYEGCLC